MILKKTLISLLILFALTQSQSLPGLDYLKSGYDGTKILNDQLGKSKQPIFDFSLSLGEQSFQFNGNDYKFPSIIQATSVSVRKESQSKQIFTTFPEFLRKYAESISFSSGFNVSNISVSLAFNRQLEELQKLMTQEGKAIAVSQSSWALYGLTTAPAFMMPLNTNFSQQLDSLNKNAKTPSSEAQQSSYNDLITQFGTHYISSAIIGGSAKVFTAFNKTYIEKTDYTKVTTELTLNYKSLVFEFTYGKNTTNTTEVPSDDFRNNTKSYLAFSPEVDHVDQESKPWAVWESKVPSTPQPLNTTVAYISDLAFQYPEVSQHLRKTIEFYLKNGKLPTYSDLSKEKVFLQSKLNNSKTQKDIKTFKLLSSSIFEEALQELCPFPGYHGTYCPAQQYSSYSAYKRQLQQSMIPSMPSGIGASFDITTGQLKLPAIQLTYQGQQIWTDPFSNNQFIIADETVIQQVDAQPEVRIFKNEFELTNIWLDATQRGQWLGGEYSQAKDLNDIFERHFKGGQETSISQLMKNVVRLTFNTDNLKLNRFAQRAVDSLPHDFIPEVYNKFLNSWGTHVAVDTYLGGMVEKQTVFKDCVYATPTFTGGLSPDQVEQALHHELSGNQADGFFAARRRVSIDHKFGGNPEDVPNWEATISQNPALLKINRFVSWDSLVADAQIKANLQQAIQNRVSSMVQRQYSYQQQVQEQRRIQRNGPRTAYSIAGYGVGFLNDQSKITIKGAFQFQEASQCPSGLPYEVSVSRCSTGEMVTSDGILSNVRYERDDQGNYRVVVLDIARSSTIKFSIYSPWVSRGCTVAQLDWTPQYTDFNQPPPYQSGFKMLCTECVPEIYNHPNGEILQCNCPSF